MLVESIMTTPVISVEPSTSLSEAARLMLAHRVSGLPVVAGNGTLLGMVTEGDFLRRGELGTERKRPWWLELIVGAGKAADEYVHANGRQVGEVMSTDVATTRRDAALEDVVETMMRRRVKRLPVVEDGKIVGIVARSDLLRAVAGKLASDHPVAKGDDERIRAAIVSELSKQSWGGRLIHVHVDHGAVELSGAIFDERERQAAHVAAENVPGVTSVIDQLAWIEPMSGTLILPPEGATTVVSSQA